MSSNTIISETRFKEYNEILKLLADKNSLIYNYVLHKINRLMEDSISRPNERIEDVKVIDFAIKAAKHLSDHKWECYDESTIAQLELFLNVMSSVLYVLSQSVEMINTEIHDQSNLDIFVSTSSKVLETVVNVVNSEYFSALSSLTDVLDFEYSAGKWYNDWREMHEKYFTLRQQPNLEHIKNFSKKLFKLSIKEFERVKEKNTSYRNIEYKVLKSGGELLGYSLPDNIDTLLIGYLHLIQRILEEFFPQIKKYIKKIIPFCNEIIETHVKKQLTFKAVEVLYVIKEKTTKQEFKEEIESKFNSWSISSDPTTSSTNISSRPLSSCSTYSTRSTYTIHSTHSTHSIDSTHLTPPNSPGEKTRRLSFSKKLITTLTNPQKEHQQQRKQIKQIVEGVNKLFEERRKIDEHINDINERYSKLSNNKRNKSIEPILSKLKEILEGIRDGSEVRSILMELKEILERNIEEEPNFEEVSSIGESSIEEVPTIEVEDTDGTNNNEVEENNDAESEKIEVVKENIFKRQNLYIDIFDNFEANIDVDETLNHQKYLDNDVIISNNAVVKDIIDVNDDNMNDVNDAKEVKDLLQYCNHNFIEEFDDALYLDNYEVIFDVDEILIHQKHLDDNVFISNNAVVKDTKDVNNDAKDIKDLLQYCNHNLIEEFDDALYLDNYEVIFDVDEILNHQKHLDDNVFISNGTVVKDVNDVKDLSKISENQYYYYKLIEEFDDSLYLDNYEVIFDIDEILKHQNYLDDVVISDNALVDELCLDDYEINGEEMPPPPPYSEKDDENLIALKELLPSPYNEYDISTLKNMLPPDYNKLDKVTIVNVIQNNYIINIQQGKNNVEDDDPSWYKTFKKIIKEVENIVDKAAKAHQAAVENEKKRRLSSNPSKPKLSEEDREQMNALFET
ncbi:17639_t:CDS:10 [Rhizophagus irregularis]|nr:17639_t:CDS:10 [Rhizophagus irregularis]